MRTLILAVMPLALAGCVASPRPAHTQLVGAESKVTSEREERRPTEDTIHIHAETPEPVYHIHVTLPAPEPVQESPK